MFFIDELDGDDGFRLVLGYCLANTVINQLSVNRGRHLYPLRTMHMRRIRLSWRRVERADCSEVELPATVERVREKCLVQTIARSKNLHPAARP